MDRGPCQSCERYPVCREPCEKLLAQLDGPDRGRLARNIRPRDSAEVDLLLEFARRLGPETDAMVHLYYRCGFTMERIARAMRLNRSSVSRRIATAWRKAARMCNKNAS